MTDFLVKINGTNLTPYLKAPGGYKVNRAKLYTDANRNMAGNLRTTFLGIFPKIMLEFRALSVTETDLIVTLLDNSSMTVEWWDIVTQSHKTGTFYPGDFEYAMHRKDIALHDGFNVSLVSFNKMT